MNRALFFALLAAVTAMPAQAQLVADGASATLSNGTNSISGDVVVGTNGAFTSLVLSNGAVLTNSGNSLIGRNASARSNEVRLVSPSAGWLMGESLFVGSNGSASRLVISNGAFVLNSNCFVGFNTSSGSNTVLVARSGTLWSNRQTLVVGQSGAGNRVVISDGARLDSRFGTLGALSSASNNEMVVTGPGSFWKLQQNFTVGNQGSGNRLLITNGGKVNGSGFIGSLNSSNNEVLVTGTGSSWSNFSTLMVGGAGGGNRLVIRDGGEVFEQPFGILLGSSSSSLNNRLVMDGGSLRALSPSGVLEVRRGTNVLNAGLIDVTELLLTNALGRFEFNGGRLSAGKSTVSNGQLFRVGNGASAATFHLAGNGFHDFSGVLAVSVASNAVLTGNGILSGGLVVSRGATLSPGASVGKIVLSNSPSLQGLTLMEISKSGSTLTNDQLQVIGSLSYGGSLTVSNAGPGALAAGDCFRLFDATNYSGAFSNVSLPPLGSGLGWSDNLLVDGSIKVVAEIVVQTSATVRVMAANLTSGNDQRYETPGLNILKGLRPDIVAIQEFNVSNSFGVNTAAALSNMVATTFGPEFSFFRESGYAIPNGIISRYPILAADSWEDSDTGISDRGFAWAQIDLPGTNDLFVVSVHLKASSGAANEARRAAEAAELKDLITTNFPAGAWVIVAGDMNLFSETEQAILTLETFLSDDAVPADQNGDPDTNASRGERYDRVLPSFSMTNRLVPLVMPSRTYTNGLVFDSRVYTPLSEVAPVQFGDSGAMNMQHMGVVKAFNIPFTVTNFFPIARDFGVDVSHFQNESGVPQSSWNQMFAEGKRFVFIKATEGLTGPHDPTMSNNVLRATTAGLLAGVYHFAHPENRPTTNGAVLEASNFVVYAGSAIGPGRLRPVLDLERGSNLTTTELTDWVIAFCNEIIARRGPGAAPIVYCNQTFANNELDSRLAGYDLWLRTITTLDVSTNEPPGQGFADATGVFTNWAFWQYSATGNSGGISPLDLNVCHSEYKPLSSFLIPNPPAAPDIQTGSLALIGGAFRFSFTSSTGETFSVLASPDPTLPLNSWTRLGTATEISPGLYQFTDPNFASQPQRFYIVRWP